MFKVIRREETKTTEWSGGTTTQLAIYPENGDYAKRDFVWRVSSARVEAEESEFTSLPGVSRCLMILDGELWLKHEGHYECQLGRFVQDNFSGSWKTVSRGKVTDFNLMTFSGEGRVQVTEMSAGTIMEIPLMPLVEEWGMVSEVFYALENGASIKYTDCISAEINKGDVIVVCNTPEDYNDSIVLFNPTQSKIELIRAIIYHDKA